MTESRPIWMQELPEYVEITREEYESLKADSEELFRIYSTGSGN